MKISIRKPSIKKAISSKTTYTYGHNEKHLRRRLLWVISKRHGH